MFIYNVSCLLVLESLNLHCDMIFYETDFHYLLNKLLFYECFLQNISIVGKKHIVHIGISFISLSIKLLNKEIIASNFFHAFFILKLFTV